MTTLVYESEHLSENETGPRLASYGLVQNTRSEVVRSAFSVRLAQVVAALLAGSFTSEAAVQSDRCHLDIREIVSSSASACQDRRTGGFSLMPLRNGQELGSSFAHASYMEAVSALAFDRLRAELVFHSAPALLIHRVEQAADQEVEHARLMGRLARRFGQTADVPRHLNVGIRPILEIARENALEGCVRETYGAIVALLRARLSEDREVRDAFSRIASDECSHAELSFLLAQWFDSRLDERQRLTIVHSRTAMMSALYAQLSEEPSQALAQIGGMPSILVRRRALMRLSSEVFQDHALGA